MAKQPHRDDDQAKKHADDTPAFKGGPKTPQPKAPGPRTPVPNLSIDEPIEAEEVLEADEAQLVEAEPAEEIEAELITGDDEVPSAEDAVEVDRKSVV